MASKSPSGASTDPSRVRIFFFGYVADRLGPETELALPPDGCSIAELRRVLAERAPEAAGALSSKFVRACLDGSVVPDSAPVLPGQEVAFIPPVSGG